jgi:hypothetical protein
MAITVSAPGADQLSSKNATSASRENAALTSRDAIEPVTQSANCTTRAGGRSVNRRTMMNMIALVAAGAAIPVANPSVAKSRPAILAIRRCRDAEALSGELYSELDEAQADARAIHGRRPAPFVTWRNNFVSGRHIEVVRDRLLEEGVGPEEVESEYQSAKQQEKGQIEGGIEWDRRAGLYDLTARHKKATEEVAAARDALSRTPAESLEEAIALIEYVNDGVEQFETIEAWEAAALANASRFFAGQRQSVAPLAILPSAHRETAPTTLDPIFAAIDSHRAAYDRMSEVLVRQERLESEIPEGKQLSKYYAYELEIVDTDAPEWISFTRDLAAASDAETQAGIDLVSVEGLTPSGARALIDYVIWREKRGDTWPDCHIINQSGKEEGDWYQFLLRRLSDVLATVPSA